MPIAVQLVNDQIQNVSDTNTLLDMLLEFEAVLDDMDLYSYKNWIEGQILEGPNTERYFVSVKLMYPEKQMPDPDGALRLMSRDCLVRYKKDTLVRPTKVQSFDDVVTELQPDGAIKQKAKTIEEPIWVVEIKMPRRYVDEFSDEVITVDDEQYDTEAVSMDSQAEAEQLVKGNYDQDGDGDIDADDQDLGLGL